MKKFSQDSKYVDELDKSRVFDEGQHEQTFLNCFQNAELEFGRKDVKTFEQIIRDLL